MAKEAKREKGLEERGNSKEEKKRKDIHRSNEIDEKLKEGKQDAYKIQSIHIDHCLITIEQITTLLDALGRLCEIVTRRLELYTGKKFIDMLAKK